MYFNWIIAAFWLIFLAYWAVSAVGVKKNVTNTYSWQRMLGRIGLGILVLLAVSSIPHAKELFAAPWVSQYNWVSLLGTILCAVGIAIAIWARAHLGRNWSGIPTLKQGHALVTTGPYHYVRHPIYTGMLLALLGSALTVSVGWLILFVIAAVVFVRRVFVEERLMMQQFPDQYPEYKKQTKALIPFIW